MIIVKNLTKNFVRNTQRFDAVHDVSFHVKEGEFAAVIGHSGSGKTTLFNMIAGLTKPTAGKILIHGSDLTQMSDKQQATFRNQNIGYVLQG